MRPLSRKRCRDSISRCRGELPECGERGLLHFIRLYHRRTLNVLVQDPDDFGIELAVVTFSELLVLPQAAAAPC